MRLFVALDLPDAVRHALAEQIARLKPSSAHSRWVPSENMHVTLKFIGHIADEKLPGIRTVLAPIRSSIQLSGPVDLRYRGVGFFPNPGRPRVLWCGVESSSNLAELAGAIESALEPLEIARESRAFTPHLTLARLDSSDPRNLVRAAAACERQDFGSACETNFHLYESILKSSGAEYKKLETYSFVKGTCAT
jgi:2'-5' RNA ligase